MLILYYCFPLMSIFLQRISLVFYFFVRGKQIMYEIFSKLLQEHGITPYKVSKETGVSQSTLSDWKRGISTPKQDKLQKIADYFGVSLEYLMTGEEKEGGEKYYLNDETAEMAQTIFNNRDLKMLFDVTKNSTPQRLRAYYNMIKELENQEYHDGE